MSLGHPSLVVMRAALLALLTVANTKAEALGSEPARAFGLVGRQLQGRDAPVCVLRGKWADGSPFYWRAWTSCSKLEVRTTTLAEVRRLAGDRLDVDGMLAGLSERDELIEVSHDFSRVVLFRDKAGVTREIPTAD